VHLDSQQHHASQPPAIATLAELRASGHEYRGVKAEIRQNLLAMMRDGHDPFPARLRAMPAARRRTRRRPARHLAARQ